LGEVDLRSKDGEGEDAKNKRVRGGHFQSSRHKKKPLHSACAAASLFMEPYCGNGGRGSSAVLRAAL